MKSPPEEELRLEDAMEELQQIVRSLESGQEPLDESLLKFERGMQLLRTCHGQLERASQRIEIVTRVDQDGNFQTEEFDSTSTLNRESETGPAKSNDDDSNVGPTRLF